MGDRRIQRVLLRPLDVDVEGDGLEPLARVVGHVAQALVAQDVGPGAVDDGAVRLEQVAQGLGVGGREGQRVACVGGTERVAQRVVGGLELRGIDPLEVRRGALGAAASRGRSLDLVRAHRVGLDRKNLVDPALGVRSPEIAPRNASAHSVAGSGPMTRPPIARTLMSSCSTPWRALYVSWPSRPGRRGLVGRITAPMPEPQTRIPRSASPADRLADGREVGVVVGGSEPSPPRSISSCPGGQAPSFARSSSLNSAPPWSAANATRIESPRCLCGEARAATRPWKPSRTTCRPTSCHGLRGVAECLQDRAGRRGRPEVVDADDRARVARVALPAEGDAGLDGDSLAHRGREHRLAVGGVLGLEDLPARQRDDPRRDALGLQGFGGLEGQVDLGAGGDRSGRASAARGVAQDVPAAAHAVARKLSGARQGRQLLAGQRQGDRPRRPDRAAPPRAPRPRRSRWRRPVGRTTGWGSRAGRRSARPAGGSGRPRRGPRSRASRRRSRAGSRAPRSGPRRACSR